MKTSFFTALLCTLAVSIFAQTPPNEPPQDTPFAVVQRGANENIWQRTTYEQLPSGKWIPHFHKYQEVATGLNFKNPDTGNWEASSEEIEIVPGGAVAKHGQHKVIFAADLDTVGAIDMETPDGQRLQSHMLGLCYLDKASGQTVFIAQVTNTIGQLISSNQVWYDNAFTGVKAGVRYTYKREGFEQDVILEEQPPTPESYGLNSATTVLQAYTEFISPPAPAVSMSFITEGNGQQLLDKSLSFSTMKIGRGRAFLSPNSSESTPVAKDWATLEGRQFLIEQVPISQISGQLQTLPPPQASVRFSNSVVNVLLAKRLLPVAPVARSGAKHMRMASASSKIEGFVLDYSSLNTSQTNYVFRGDVTYYISGNVNLYGTNTTFEGGTVLKYDSGYSLTINTPVTWGGSVYRPVLLLSKDDNSIAEALPGSSGNPGNSYYAARALYFDGTSASTNLNIDNLRILNAQAGVVINGRANHVLSNVQIAKCANGIIATNADFSVRNALFSSVLTNFTGLNATGHVEQLTSDAAAWLNKDVVTNLYLTNCILSAITNLGNCISQNVASVSSGAGVFQSVGNGGYYLTDGSIYRDAGTANINPALLTQLALKTTYPPVLVINSNFNAVTTLGPVVQRDTDTPDLGYHYDPMDYVFSGVEINSNLTITAGTAVGWFKTNGNAYAVHIADKQIMTFTGLADLPDYFVRSTTVQEGNGQWIGNGAIGIAGTAEQDLEDVTLSPELRMNFTLMSGLIWDQQFKDYNGYLIVRANNSVLAGGNSGGFVISCYFTNCLMDNQQVGTVEGHTGNEIYLRNCTLHNGIFYGSRAIDIPISVRDCAFDQVTLYNVADDYSSDPTNTDYSYNAYPDATDPFPSPAGASHDQASVTFNWQTGPLGRFYLPTDSVLINQGHTNANFVGLYHFTTQTDQSREADTMVDIGYHYVALGCGSADTIWVEDALPAGASPSADWDAWTWVSSSPRPFSGQLANQSANTAGVHQHYFTGATATLTINPGEALIAYVYLDPVNTPSEIMLQWNDGTWDHRAYWGANDLSWGTDGTASQYHMGALPAAGRWVRLEVPASIVGLEGSTLNGMAFTLYDGRATWDYAGKSSSLCYDADGDGLANYLEDANGDGIYDAGDPFDWKTPDANGGGGGSGGGTATFSNGSSLLILEPKPTSQIP